MNYMKGQFTIFALVMVFVSIIVFVILYPTINTFITDFTANSSDTTLNMVIQLLPFFMLLAIILSVVFYAIPQRQVGGY